MSKMIKKTAICIFVVCLIATTLLGCSSLGPVSVRQRSEGVLLDANPPVSEYIYSEATNEYVPYTTLMIQPGVTRKASDNGYIINLYSLSEDKLSLQMQGYKLSGADIDSEIDEALTKLLKENDNGISYSNFGLRWGVLTVDLNSSYDKLKPSEEILTRASIVLTMMQIDGVRGVQLTVAKAPLSDRSGRNVGVMSSSDFADIDSISAFSSDSLTVTIYFADESGKKIIPVSCSSEYIEKVSMERFVVERLIEGPNNESYTVNKNEMGKFAESILMNQDTVAVYGTLSPEVKVVSISTKDNICYVNFNEEFVNTSMAASGEAVIYSIVNSLCSLNYVDKVQILVNGDSDIMFHDVISLKKPFSRNLDVIFGYQLN